MRSYVAAVDSLSIEAVTRSVQQFRDGLVERPNRDFVPSAEAFAANARDWQRAIDSRNSQGGITLHTGILNMDFGAGSIDMRGLTEAEQDAVIAAKGRAPDGRSFAYLPLAEIKAALQQGDLAAVEGGKTFSAPRLGRMP